MRPFTNAQNLRTVNPLCRYEFMMSLGISCGQITSLNIPKVDPISWDNKFDILNRCSSLKILSIYFSQDTAPIPQNFSEASPLQSLTILCSNKALRAITESNPRIWAQVSVLNLHEVIFEDDTDIYAVLQHFSAMTDLSIKLPPRQGSSRRGVPRSHSIALPHLEYLSLRLVDPSSDVPRALHVPPLTRLKIENQGPTSDLTAAQEMISSGPGPGPCSLSSFSLQVVEGGCFQGTRGAART
ncbi:hypothetical protein H0H81_010353 [Sphagnurus paluster]|uniref:Uncharacterized protein n=1 Tax=Sphagnurus paluster TaxID=117069 RepID=A0A9P7FRJ7_9AGAR|nr:hypothetical protein H0H81_010353 [Sphagnurus paluster]